MVAGPYYTSHHSRSVALSTTPCPTLMPLAHKRSKQLAESTQELYNRYNAMKELSPRVRMALRMYVNAAVPTLGEAARAVGINYNHLALCARSPVGQEFMTTAHEIINDKAAATNVLIEKLGRRALEVIGQTMEDSQSEALRLKAAIDLADRSPETAKSQKLSLEAFTLEGKDAQLLAQALAEGKEVEARFAEFKIKNHEPAAIADDNEVKLIPEGNPALVETKDAEDR